MVALIPRVIAVTFHGVCASIPLVLGPCVHSPSLCLHSLCHQSGLSTSHFSFMVCLFVFLKRKKKGNRYSAIFSEVSVFAIDFPSASLCPVTVATFPSFHFSLIFRRRPLLIVGSEKKEASADQPGVRTRTLLALIKNHQVLNFFVLRLRPNKRPVALQFS